MPDTNPVIDARQEQKKAQQRFIGYLYSLAKRDDGAARAALAELRRAGTDASYHLRALCVVGDFIPDTARGWTLESYLLTAELFALYAAGGKDIPSFPEKTKQTTLGASARYVNPRMRTAHGDYVDAQPGIGSRFSALLTLPAEDLPDELRRFVRLLRSKDAPIDFFRLLPDLIRWPDFEQPTQKTWARQYWAAVPETTDSSNT